MPKTLAEIALDAGLVTKAGIVQAGKHVERRRVPLVVALIRELGVDEVALLGAIRKQTRVPLIDPAEVHADDDALRSVPRDVCARLRLLPLALSSEGAARVLRVAMADPTDTAAILELEQLTACEIEAGALSLSAIDELIERGYRRIDTAVVGRPGHGRTMFITSRGSLPRATDPEVDSEVSVTAQIPLAALQQAVGTHDLEARLEALIRVLAAKGLVTEAELDEAVRRGRPGAGPGDVGSGGAGPDGAGSDGA